MLKTLLRHRIKLALIALLGASVAVVGIILWEEQYNLEDVLRLKNETLAWLKGTHPAIVLASIALLPLFGFPVSPLLIIAGVTYGGTGGMVVGTVGMALTNTLGYAIAARLRGPVQIWVERKGITVPDIPPRDYVKIVLLFRVTPGFPVTFQNYLLGLARVPFNTYFWVSLPPQLVTVAGFVLTGGALFEGKIGLVLLGVSLILVFAIVGRIVQQQLKKKQTAAES